MDRKRKEYAIIEPGNPETRVDTLRELLGIAALAGTALLDVLSKLSRHNADDIRRQVSNRP